MNQWFTYSVSSSSCRFAEMHTFSAKEKDSETGLSYFGSRYYSSDLSIWLSVDPMSDKYPSLSPYTYCADNPVKLVDPNGEEWDIDGYKYYPGQECPDDAQQSTRDKWNAMNTIYSTKEGKDVIDHMNKKGVWYCVSSESCPSKIAGGQYVPDGNKTGGTIFLNGGADIGTLAHEMFHGYQDQKNQGGVSQHNELQARLFSDDITSQVQLKVATGLPQLQITEQGISADLFNYNVGKVRSGSYTDINMGQLEELFSSFERFRAYRNNHVKIDGQTDLYGELKNK
jgi:RHS repeat-associated protein